MQNLLIVILRSIISGLGTQQSLELMNAGLHQQFNLPHRQVKCRSRPGVRFEGQACHKGLPFYLRIACCLRIRKY